jgi:hypothetical protein
MLLHVKFKELQSERDVKQIIYGLDGDEETRMKKSRQPRFWEKEGIE